MSQFEKSEVMVEYANLMHTDDMVKEALIPLILGIGAALLGLYWGGKKVIDALSRSNNNIADLKYNLERLEPNPMGKATVDRWIQQLEYYVQATAVPSLPEDTAKRTTMLQKKLEAMEGALKLVKEIQDNWPRIKPTLTDWYPDRNLAETTINKTVQQLAADVVEQKRDLQAASQKVMQQMQQSSGLNYKQLSDELLGIYEQIKRLSGEAPVPDNASEQQALGLAQAIRANKPITKEQLEQYGPYLSNSVQSLRQLVTRLRGTQSPSKTSSVLPAISKRAGKVMLSKRAWHLYDEKPTGEVAGQKPRRIQRDQTTMQLQKSINHLNVSLRTGVGRIDEDGIYGPQTALALKGLMDANESVSETFRKYGIDDAVVMQPNVMRRSKIIPAAAKILDKVVRIVAGQEPGTQAGEVAGDKAKEPEKAGVTQEQGVQKEKILNDLERRRDLSDREILYYINNKAVTEPSTGRRATIREFINENTRNMPGITPESMKHVPGASSAVDLIKSIFFVKGPTAPIEWDIGQLFAALSGGTYGRLF